MHGKYRESRAGFTLVEVLVVLAIVALVSAIAIPGLAKLGAFSRDEFKRATQDTYSILRAAQLYATTYNVNTAVVYSMDHYSPAEAGDPYIAPENEVGTDLGEPISVDARITDSLTGAPVRQIEAAAVMYELSSTMGPLAGRYVPVAGELGEFRPLPQGMSILLISPEPEDIDTTDPTNPIFGEYYAEFDFSNYRSSALVNRIGRLGMSRITAALGLPQALAGPDLYAFANDPTLYQTEKFPAHIFRPSGRISMPDFGAPECSAGCGGERFSLYIAPTADRPLDERLVQPELIDLVYTDTNGVVRSNLRYKEIQIFKSTGRIAVPQDF